MDQVSDGVRMVGRKAERLYLSEPDLPQVRTIIDEQAEAYGQESLITADVHWGGPGTYASSLDSGGMVAGIASHHRRSKRLRPLAAIALLVGIVIWSASLPFGAWDDLLVVDKVADQLEWPYESTGLRQAADEFELTGDGVRVCIVDTGINVNHPDLDDAEIEFKDFLTRELRAGDRSSTYHGTMMSGLLVANGTLLGAAPRVTLIMAVALGDAKGSGEEDLVADAIDWCVNDRGAHIISLSLGGQTDVSNTRDSPPVSAIERALDRGIFVVAAAGNDGGVNDDGFVATPANIPDVISVAAIQRNGAIWEQSSAGSPIDGANGRERMPPNQKPEISAPGFEIVSTGPDDSYIVSSGTSDATVFVAGGLALLLERHPEFRAGLNDGRTTIRLVKEAMMDTAVPSSLQETPHDAKYGYGILDARSLVAFFENSSAA